MCESFHYISDYAVFTVTTITKSFLEIFLKNQLLSPCNFEECNMEKQKMLFGIIATLICSLLMISGCTQQQGSNQTSTESLQTILEKAETIESVYYELDSFTTITDAPGQNSTIKIWQKTPYLKEEMTSTTGNITTTFIVIKRPEGIYRYDATENRYQLFPGTISQPSFGETTKDLLNNQTITTLGTETIDGKTATIIQYTPNQTGNSTTMKMWIWNEKGVPLKALLTVIKGDISLTTDYQYSMYSFSDIPDSTFSVE
jgi:outer membrane lipoprotein-sorting protein